MVDDDGGKKVYTRWELDYTLSSNDKLDLLDEYLEMGEQANNMILLTRILDCKDTSRTGDKSVIMYDCPITVEPGYKVPFCHSENFWSVVK